MEKQPGPYTKEEDLQIAMYMLSHLSDLGLNDKEVYTCTECQEKYEVTV